MPISIAPMQPTQVEDAAAFVQTLIASMSIYNDQARQLEIERHGPTQLATMVKDDPDAVLLAYEENRLVGFVISYQDDGPLWLAWFGVAPDYRTRGLGRQLLTALEETAPRRNAHKIWCDCRTDNTASRACLTKAGYTLLTEIKNHWHGQDYLLWEKLLES